MGEEEERLVREAFRSNWLSTVGPHIDAFEREVAEYLADDTYVLAVSSGTAALHLVLRYIGVGRGDRVAVSTLTFAGSVYPILYLGAKPVLIDSETTSGNLDASLVAEHFESASRRNELPKALVVVHLYGQHADVDAIIALCDRYGVALVEDSAESLGAKYRGRETGTTAPYAILSFNGNKIITTTGGGMVLAKDPAAIARMRKWSTQSREPALEYLHAELGYNYRMSNVLAAIGRGQLTVLEERVAARRRVAERYAAELGDLPGFSLQEEAPWGTHTRWLTVMYLDPDECATNPLDLIRTLGEDNIEARPVWRPMHTQPLFANCERVGGHVAEQLFRTGICLPSSSNLSLTDQDRVITKVRSSAMAVSVRGQ
ncbi:MAG: DegT/DnrJ/EryC1/StrS family aminotransferase [Gemmatimonadaceae bacterium]